MTPLNHRTLSNNVLIYFFVIGILALVLNLLPSILPIKVYRVDFGLILTATVSIFFGSRIIKQNNIFWSKVTKTQDLRFLFSEIIKSQKDKNSRSIIFSFIKDKGFRSNLEDIIWKGELHEIFKGKSIVFSLELRTMKLLCLDKMLDRVKRSLVRVVREQTDVHPRAFASVMKNEVSQILFALSPYMRRNVSSEMLEHIVRVIRPTIMSLSASERNEWLKAARLALLKPGEFYKDSRKSRSLGNKLAWYEESEFGPTRGFGVRSLGDFSMITSYQGDYLDILRQLEGKKVEEPKQEKPILARMNN